VLFDDLLKPLTEYFKGKPYWSAIQPALTLLSLYIAASVLAYEYLQAQYSLAPLQIGEAKLPLLNLFFHSYVFKQITLVAVTVGVVGLFFRIMDPKSARAGKPAWVERIRHYRGPLLKRAIVVLVVLAIAIPTFRRSMPRDVSNVRVLFFKDPDQEFDESAFIYLLYELNARQSRWHFDVEYDVFNRNAHADEFQACEGEPLWLCVAEKEAAGRPLIALTTEPLEPDHFWQNRANVSVITTADWTPYAPPSMYEYLIYSVIVQSVLIHLNTECSGLPPASFQESRIGFGDLFEFSPRRYAMKPAILSAHLSPVQQVMLMNCFGPGYVNTASSLITLGWLRSDPVKRNLKASFRVDLDGPAAK
jgi:hypothetical protein